MIKKILAFSIVEIISVIVIIGLLAAVSLPGYQKAIVKGHERMAIANLLAIKATTEIYLVNSGNPTIPNMAGIAEINNTSNAPSVGNAVWDVSLWDEGIWEAGQLLHFDRVTGGTGIGRYISVAIRGQALAGTILASTDFSWDKGWFL